MRKFIFVMAASALSVSPCVVLAKKAPALEGLALQQVQARDFETTKEIAFASVMTVLQDAGYRVEQADKDTGFITAISSTKGKATFNLLWGFGRKKQSPVITAFVEQRGALARIRLNYVMATVKSRNVYSDETPITDPQVYQQAFEKIDKEIFIRHSAIANPSATPSVASASAVAPK